MKIRSMLFAPLALFALSSIGLAEEHDKKTDKMNTKMDKMGKSMTMTGCLNKGDMAEHYAFTDMKGKKMMVTGSADLEKHSANHTVKLTGSKSGKMFNVTAIEHVSPTCEMK